MESLKIDKIIEILRLKSITFFTYQDFKQLFPGFTDIGLSVALKRLVKTKTISRVEKGKYLFLLSRQQPNDYATANFIYQPSYVSLETALSFYGIIDQFTYQITSITTKKTNLKTYNNKEFSYSHIDKKLFTDYQLQDEHIIASPNKAIFDYLYLAYKGIRSKQNISLIHLTNSQKNKFLDYVNNYHMPKLKAFIKNNL